MQCFTIYWNVDQLLSEDLLECIEVWPENAKDGTSVTSMESACATVTETDGAAANFYYYYYYY